MFCFSFVCYGDHRDLHLLTHSFPTRRSSDRRAPAALAEHRLRRREAGGVGALETEDRLFRIADGEDRPLALARTLPGEELADQGIRDRPLIGVGALSLVDQLLVDAAVALVLSPGGGSAHTQRGAPQNGNVELQDAAA